MIQLKRLYGQSDHEVTNTFACYKPYNVTRKRQLQAATKLLWQ